MSEEADGIRRALRATAKEIGVQLRAVDEVPALSTGPELIVTEISDADLIVAHISDEDANLYYEVGLAQASGKVVLLLVNENSTGAFRGMLDAPALNYRSSPQGFEKLQIQFRRFIDDFRRRPEKFRPFARRSLLSALPVVDLDRLEPREFENLCFELLTLMGFRRVDWGKEMREIDAVATLPKKDPDGFEYNELWLISMGLHAPPEMLIDIAMKDPEMLIHRLMRPDFPERYRSLLRQDTPLTLLLISLRSDMPSEMLEIEMRRFERRMSEKRYPYTLRVRAWDRQKVTTLIQQYPLIANKYFSEEGRAQSKYRKTPEELYKENVELTERLQAMVIALNEERDKRARAERDAVWKDVAFKAAHKLGNPIFALETDLQGLKRRVANKPKEALEVADEMEASIEKAKSIIEQFKSLIRAQEIKTRPVDLVPILKSAARVATENGVKVDFIAPEKPLLAMADATRMTECFDELFANALHWFNKEAKTITVTLELAKKKNLPTGFDDSKKYLRVEFKDNGPGIPLDKKSQIFLPFYTTHPHGTGLGLSVVERIVEGHGGVVHEMGTPGEGATFEILLPQAAKEK